MSNAAVMQVSLLFFVSLALYLCLSVSIKKK